MLEAKRGPWDAYENHAIMKEKGFIKCSSLFA